MKKRLCFILLAVAMFISLFPTSVFADEDDKGTDITGLEVNNGVLSVSLANPDEGSVKLRVYDGPTLIYSDEIEADGSAVQFGIPVRSIPSGEYNLSVAYINKDGEQSSSKSITRTIGTSGLPVYASGTTYANSTGDLIPTMQTPGFCRAVMIPYATVYADSGMTNKQHELKRLDIVNILSCNDTIAHVQYTIQSGEGTISVIDDHNAEYQGHENDITGTGYMYMSSFESSATNDEDKQREVVELAYSRLGMKGIYSQSKRYIGFYVDCSALASWCWYQVGMDFGLDTSCDGIYDWAKSITDRNVIVWDAKEDSSHAKEEIDDYRGGNAHAGAPCTDTFSFVNGDKKYTESELTSYDLVFESKILDKMEPGDIVLYNKYETVTESTHNGVFSFPIKESGSSHGLDHAAIFVGLDDGKAQFIEASVPSEDASKNTKFTTLTSSSSEIKNIVAVIRPTGGEVIEGGVSYESIGYGGASHIEFNGNGTLSAPIANPAYNNGSFVSSEYGMRFHPVHHVMRMHSGVDIRATWNMPIYAANDGVVYVMYNGCPAGHHACGHGGGYGNYVDIHQGDGLSTRYAHMNKVVVSNGQEVKAGDLVGYVGSSGTSTGPHLHFEVRINGQTDNPRRYVQFVN